MLFVSDISKEKRPDDLTMISANNLADILNIVDGEVDPIQFLFRELNRHNQDEKKIFIFKLDGEHCRSVKG